MNCFDEKKWSELIKSPDWYLSLTPELKTLAELKGKDKEYYKVCKEKVYSFFENHLREESIILGKEGKNWDEERGTIDTIVIHHTSGQPEMTNERLSAMTLVRLYAPYYTHPYNENDKNIVGQPIWSNHIRNRKQVFWPYHWIVRTDGSVERLLNDNEIGWQSGNWDINTRSVAIVLDNNYENSRPSQKELKAVADIIKENYGFVVKENIIGHREVKRNTKISKTITCPSNLFLSEGSRRGWKENLLAII